MFTPFTGNGYYCFTNSLYMVLEGCRAHPLPGTHFIECLTTMPFGNTFLALAESPLVFFSAPNMNPDMGLSLAIETLGWKADNIPYKRGSYTFRHHFRQVRKVRREEMTGKTLERIPANLACNPDGPVAYGGIRALALLADTLRTSVPARLEAHLVWFALPLAARRANDAARFFHEAKIRERVDLHLQKARLFGQANYHAVRRDWKEVARIVERLIPIEEELAYLMQRIAVK